MSDRFLVRHAPAVIAAAPLGAAVLGSLFNIWYNVTQVDPLLTTEQQARFSNAIILYNGVAYPILVLLWLGTVWPIHRVFRTLLNGDSVSAESLTRAQVRAINLPWFLGGVLALGWLLSAPALTSALNGSADQVDTRVLFHLPVSILIAALITITHGFLIVELLAERLLFPVLFVDRSPAGINGTISLSMNRRNLLCAVAVCVCPILSLVLLAYNDAGSLSGLNWFMIYVGAIGILLGMFCSWMVSTHVVGPINALQQAARVVASGSLDAKIEVQRADEFGPLIDEFNHMIDEMRSKRDLRQRFGLHVGRRTAELILAQDPGLGGCEQQITVMFCDIRNFTARCAQTPASGIVPLLNRFLTMMVEIVEDQFDGNVNKFLGDGFMALFGIGVESPSEEEQKQNARSAVQAGLAMISRLEEMNAELKGEGIPDLGIGIGLHFGTAIVGSLGSQDRLEYTAIGDTVNVASRVEGLTKHLGVPLLVTRQVRNFLGDDFAVQAMEPQEVKGQPKPLEIFAIDF
jgi:adenylate cyclase